MGVRHASIPKVAALLLAGLAAAGLAGIAVLALQVRPGATPPKSDLIVVLAGDTDRMPHARRLVEAGLAPRAVSTSYDPACVERGGTRAACASGVRNTVDEALYARFVLASEGVRRLTVVTSGYHVRRAGVVFRIVFLGTGIEVAMASPGGGSRRGAPSSLAEGAKILLSAAAAAVARVSPPAYCWLTRCPSSRA